MHWSKSIFKPRRLFFLATLLALCTFAISRFNQPTHAAASFPPGFVSEVVIGDGLFLPTAIAFAPDNRIFIAEKRGVVRVWQNGALLPTPFIDLQDEVSDHGDRGLLGLAVHPNFPATPYIYVLYVYDPPGVTRDANGSRVSRLLRVTASAGNPNVAATTAGSRIVLMGTNSTLANSGNVSTLDDQENAACGRNPDYVRDCMPADFDTHDIGTVMFGKDGMLYVGNGDAASFLYADKRSLRALDLDSMAGKIFRIDPLTGAGLSDNPFYNGDPNANRSKVLSLGLRNPFRFTLHPTTNELYLGDVGMDSWEEINVGKGKNFGWPCYEGNDQGSAQQGLYANSPTTAERCRQLYAGGLGAVKAPAYSYNHAGAGGAATSGGAFYTGTTYPAQYRGAMFISDYNRDWIRYLTFDAQGRATVNNFAEDVSGPAGPAQLIVGPDTNLYYVVLGAVNEVRRIRYVNTANQPPVAHLQAAPTSGGTPLTVRFSSADSSDPEAQTLRFAWEFGDGAVSNQPNPAYTYQAPGTYMARLTVIDAQGMASSEQVEIIVGNSRPVVAINTPANGTRYTIGSRISFGGTATDAEDGNLSGILQWKALLHHNEHVHFDFFSFTGANGTFIVPDHGDNTYYELCATAGDSAGASATTQCIELRPNTVQYTFTSVPSGLQLNYAGATYTTPFTVTTIPNSVREISAPTTQNGQNGLNFVSWSDGGARAHDLTIGASNLTLTAIYQGSGGGGPVSGAENVIWNNPVNTTATGNSLRKTGGSSDGTFDGSGIGQQTLLGNGYLEFTAAGPAVERACGLTSKASFDRPESLDFAVSFNEGGYAEFRENGAYIGDTPFVNGDVFRIQLEGGRAQYLKNGALLATGNNTPAAQLKAVAVFNLPNGEIANAKLSGSSGNNVCAYSIAPQSQVSTAAGGTGTLGVTAGAGCVWTATSDATWLTITSGASGSGNGTVSYSVAANPGGQRAGTLTVAGLSFTVVQASADDNGGGSDTNVVWVNPVNATLTSSVLQKTRGADDGSWDGSAISQQILFGGGWLEFSASGPDVYRACGLTDDPAPGDPDTLDFAVVFTNSDIAEFRENGVYVGDARFIKGDVFRIVINGGLASYYKNGELLFTGRQTAAPSLRAAAVFSNLNGEITNAKLGARP